MSQCLRMVLDVTDVGIAIGFLRKAGDAIDAQPLVLAHPFFQVNVAIVDGWDGCRK